MILKHAQADDDNYDKPTFSDVPHIKDTIISDGREMK